MRIVIIGFGVVGQSLIRIILHRHSELIKNYGFNPKIVAIVDRGGAAIHSKGLDLEKMLSLKAEKGTVAASKEYGLMEMPALGVIESVEAEAVIETTPTNLNTFQVPYEYKEDNRCEIWDKFIKETLPEDQIILLQEMMGYALINNNSAK